MDEVDPESQMITTTREAALDALTGALADVDNPTAAARALGDVARQFQPPAPTSWEAFRYGSEQLLQPWFQDESQAVVWAVVDPYFGRVLGDGEAKSSDSADDGVPDSGPRVRCMADVAPEHVTWLWGARIPRGKLTEIVGDPGVGKSTLTAEIISNVTSGRALPGDESAGSLEATNVLLLSAEDGAGDTIRPRLDRAGADVSRVHLFDGIVTVDGVLTPFNLKDPLHRYHLSGLIEELGVGLLVIDPLTAYLGGVDSHRDAEVRGILTPLAEMAEASGCAVLAIRHLNKGSGGRAIYRAGGSIGFTGAVRSSMLVGQVDEESEERAIVVIKANLSAFPPPVGFSLANGRFKWTGTPDVGASDLLRPDADPDERTDRSETAEWLLDVLRAGPLASAEVFKRAAAELSVSEKTVKRAKRGLLGVVETYRESHGNDGAGRWVWRLSQEGHGTPDPLANSETDPLAETVIEQGLSAPKGPQNPQGGQRILTDPLADSTDLDADVFEGLEE